MSVIGVHDVKVPENQFFKCYTGEKKAVERAASESFAIVRRRMLL